MKLPPTEFSNYMIQSEIVSKAGKVGKGLNSILSSPVTHETISSVDHLLLHAP